MESSPSTTAERAELLNVAIDAPDALEPRNMLHPPSASSAASCSTAQAATLMPSANPPQFPAWEGKRGNEPHPVQARLALSPAGLDHARGLPFPIRPSTSAPHPTASPVPANTAGPQEFSAVHLRPDLMPPGAGSTQHQEAASAAAAAAAAAASPGAPPSPAGPSEINDADSPAFTRAGFFGSSSTTTTTPTMHTPIPRSPSPSSADMSGIFHLDLDSPLAGQATNTPREDEVAAAEDEDRVQDSPEEEKAGESSPRQAPAAVTSNNAVATRSPGFSVPWGRVAPSPDSSDALQGPWGLLQEVLDVVPVLSPSSPTSQQRHPFLHGDRTSSATPSTEERKGFARSTTATMPSRGRLASASSSSGIIVDRRQGQQQLQQSHRSPSPSSPRIVTSPPTPAASTGNTPTHAARQHDPSASASAAPSPSPSSSSSASRLPLPAAVSVSMSGRLPTVDEQLRSASSSGEGSGLNEPAVEQLKLQEEQQPPVPPPGGALGASSSASFASRAEVAIPTGAAETPSVGFGGEKGHKFGGPGGDKETGGLVAAVALREKGSVGGRGYVGKRFIRAAEALSESPQLRRAAGAAATAVSAAADTARVQFTYTSKTIGKILEASAKSFEEFVDEQLREDGSGQVLRREGGTGLLVPRSKILSQAFIVTPGCCLCWEFRVKDHDLGFGLRRRSQGMGGSTEEDIFELKRYPSGKTFQGRWTADGDTSALLIMVFDNSYSCLRPKTLAYKVQVNRPGFDPTAPPRPPPPTPVDTPTVQASQRRSSSPVFGSGGGGGASAGGVAGGGDTEAFAIDESEGEGGEPSSSSSSRPAPTYGVSDKKGGAGQEQEQEKRDCGGAPLSHAEGDAPAKSGSKWEGAEPGFAGGGKKGSRGRVEEEDNGAAGGSEVSETIKIEHFLAMTKTSGGGGGGGGDGRGPSK